MISKYKRKILDKRNSEMFSMYQTGKSLEEVGLKFKVGKSTVHRAIKQGEKLSTV